MAPGVRRYNRQIVVDWSPLANAPHPEDDEVAGFAANRQRGATFELCTEIRDLRRQPTRSSSSGLTRGSIPDHRSRIRISEGTPHRLHTPFPVWLLTKSREDRCAISLGFLRQPLRGCAVARTLTGSAWKDGRPFGRSSGYVRATKRPPVRCSCPEYLRRGHPAFAPGCCHSVRLRSFEDAGLATRSRGEDTATRGPGRMAPKSSRLFGSGPCDSQSGRVSPLANTGGAHRPHGLSLSVRSGTDRCPSARSAHPFPVQRYLRGDGKGG